MSQKDFILCGLNRKKLVESKAKFILSTWLSNKYRTNEYIFSVWEDCFVSTKEHFYHIGGKEKNRNAVYEAILSNIKLKDSIANTEMKLRIENEHSRLTAKKKEYKIPLQLALAIEEEQKRLKTAL